MEINAKKHVVIAGVGFGGLHAYQELTKKLRKSDEVEITLINKGDSFVFIPMIHEVATGLLQPYTITQPIRLLSHEFMRDFVDAEIKEINLDDKNILVERSEGFTENISYDYLVLGLGSVTHFFDIPGAQENALPLRTLDDAEKIKNRVLEMFDRADAAYDDGIQKEMIRFVVVGGGATGVELAGELSDLISDEMAHAFPHLSPHGEVILIDRGDMLMKESPKLADRARCLLEKWKCVDVRLNTEVKEIQKAGVVTDTEYIEANTVVWTAGVHANLTKLDAQKDVVRDEWTHRIAVDECLAIPGYQDVFVVGDQALLEDPKTLKPYGMRAQFATEQGYLAGENIVASVRGKKRKTFSWKDRGVIVSLGKGGALADLFGMRFSGFVARFIYRYAYLIAIVGVRAKLRTALEWSINFFAPRDISRI